MRPGRKWAITFVISVPVIGAVFGWASTLHGVSQGFVSGIGVVGLIFCLVAVIGALGDGFV